MIGDIFDKILGIFKPLEDIIYKFYDNDYLLYAVAVLGILLFIGLGFLIFKFVMGFFT